MAAAVMMEEKKQEVPDRSPRPHHEARSSAPPRFHGRGGALHGQESRRPADTTHGLLPAQEKGAGKAICAAARKLLTVIYVIPTKPLDYWFLEERLSRRSSSNSPLPDPPRRLDIFMGPNSWVTRWPAPPWHSRLETWAFVTVSAAGAARAVRWVAPAGREGPS
jgi:hypothetical protein